MEPLNGIWQELDTRVEAGRFPGYAAAVSVGAVSEVRTHGFTAVDGGEPVREDTQFRIASLTKPMGGVLALRLVEEGVLGLDDPVDRWLPEASAPQVLRSATGALDEVTPASGPVTVRHLLNGTSGWGCVMAPSPLLDAMIEGGVYPSPLPRSVTADQFVSRVCALPLAFEPGSGWLYETGLDLLGVLLARATGESLGALFASRIFGPLGLTSTSFVGSASHLAVLYRPDDDTDTLAVLDPPDGVFSRPAGFEELGSGLVSTVGDVFRFFQAMRDGGSPVLSPASYASLTHDELSPAVRASGFPLLGPGESWGLGVSVDASVSAPWQAAGRWGWTGGTGTTAYVDPARGTVSVLLTQRAMTGPQDGFEYFWSAVAQAATVH